MKSLKLGEVMDKSLSEADSGSEDDAAYTDVDTDMTDDDVYMEEEERPSNAHVETQERYGRCRQYCDCRRMQGRRRRSGPFLVRFCFCELFSSPGVL